MGRYAVSSVLRSGIHSIGPVTHSHSIIIIVIARPKVEELMGSADRNQRGDDGELHGTLPHMESLIGVDADGNLPSGWEI